MIDPGEDDILTALRDLEASLRGSGPADAKAETGYVTMGMLEQILSPTFTAFGRSLKKLDTRIGAIERK